MSRSEFSKAIRKAALSRSGMLCEAIGAWYGLDAGRRCNGPLGYGVEFDHITADSHGGENSLENCAAVCLSCHRFKTAKRDVPIAAKIKRLELKNLGAWPKSRTRIVSRGFTKSREI